MPLAKRPSTLPNAQAPAASTATTEAPAQQPTGQAIGASPLSLAARLKKLDGKDAKILVQGMYQATLHSVGAVQHGGKTPEDYANRVDWLAQTIIDRELTLLGH